VPPDPSSRSALLAAFLAQIPPRRVPPELRRAANRQSGLWFLGLFGLMFGGLGLFFVWMFFPWNFPRDWQLRGAPVAPGRVLSSDRTNLSENRQRVYRYDFEFTPPAGAKTRGTCYTSGQRWSPGAAIGVRYLPDNPAVNCIDGARSSQASGAAAFVVIFPLVGAAAMTFGLVARRRRRFLLEEGRVGEARVAAVESTAMQINRQTVFRITLQGFTDSGRPVVVRKYDSAHVDLARERLASNQPVFVLYDPEHPDRVILPETLL